MQFFVFDIARIPRVRLRRRAARDDSVEGRAIVASLRLEAECGAGGVRGRSHESIVVLQPEPVAAGRDDRHNR